MRGRSDDARRGEWSRRGEGEPVALRDQPGQQLLQRRDGLVTGPTAVVHEDDRTGTYLAFHGRHDRRRTWSAPVLGVDRPAQRPQPVPGCDGLQCRRGSFSSRTAPRRRTRSPSSSATTAGSAPSRSPRRSAVARHIEHRPRHLGRHRPTPGRRPHPARRGERPSATHASGSERDAASLTSFSTGSAMSCTTCSKPSSSARWSGSATSSPRRTVNLGPFPRWPLTADGRRRSAVRP
jgi:hypothetical protein